MILDGCMLNKRGLSNIVATVLIVLLALAAVAIVWQFLRPTFDRAASQTSLRMQCSLVNFEVTQCSVIDPTGTHASTSVTYVLNSISDEVKLQDVVVVVEDSSGVTATNDNGAAPEVAAASQVASVDTSSLAVPSDVAPYKAKVAARLTDGTNDEVCFESTPVACEVK